MDVQDHSVCRYTSLSDALYLYILYVSLFVLTSRFHVISIKYTLRSSTYTINAFHMGSSQ